MHGLMSGMFWGGLVMAVPPVLAGLGLLLLVQRERRTDRRAKEGAPRE